MTRDEAKAYAKENLIECCKQIVEYRSSFKFDKPPMRTLIDNVESCGELHGDVVIAAAIVSNLAIERVANERTN